MHSFHDIYMQCPFSSNVCQQGEVENYIFFFFAIFQIIYQCTNFKGQIMWFCTVAMQMI